MIHLSNEELYYSLPDNHKGVSTTYPANYDGELDDAIIDYGDKMDLTHEELMSMRVKPQFLIEDDDEYQDQLELQWYKEEMRSNNNNSQ